MFGVTYSGLKITDDKFYVGKIIIYGSNSEGDSVKHTKTWWVTSDWGCKEDIASVKHGCGGYN